MELPSSLVIPQDAIPDRADKILADCLAAAASRSSLARIIRSGRVLVKGRPISPSTVLSPGDRIEILPETIIVGTTPDIELPSFGIIFEDEDLIVVDKPPGIVVHPGAGRTSNTLMDILVSTRPEMVGVGEQGRWGVVHRLDRDTSGVMVLAKTASAHAALSAQFKAHSIHRVYLALVRGNPGEESGTVDAPIGRHVKERKRISTKTGKARPRSYKVGGQATLWRPDTSRSLPGDGRTHQIRVHLAYVGLPVAGDTVYGKMRRKGGVADPRLRKALEVLKRQALHAAVLGFVHPISLKYVEFSSPLPADMAEAVKTCSAVSFSRSQAPPGNAHDLEAPPPLSQDLSVHGQSPEDMGSQAEPGNQAIIRSFWGGVRGGTFCKKSLPGYFYITLTDLLCNQLGEVDHFQLVGLAHHVARVFEHGDAVGARSDQGLGARVQSFGDAQLRESLTGLGFHPDSSAATAAAQAVLAVSGEFLRLRTGKGGDQFPGLHRRSRCGDPDSRGRAWPPDRPHRRRASVFRQPLLERGSRCSGRPPILRPARDTRS